jgi:hypothetical protein
MAALLAAMTAMTAMTARVATHKVVKLSNMTESMEKKVLEACALSVVEMDVPEDKSIPSHFKKSDLTINWKNYHDEPAATPDVRNILENIM